MPCYDPQDSRRQQDEGRVSRLESKCDALTNLLCLATWDGRETTTVSQVIEDAKAAAKLGKWLSCTYRIATDRGTFSLGIKAFGRWVQVLQCVDMKSSIPGQLTWKAFERALRDEVDGIVRRS
jgi:hypothetical protein